MKAVSATFTNLACMVVAYCKGWMNPLGIVVCPKNKYIFKKSYFGALL
jgi:hypothetical protein